MNFFIGTIADIDLNDNEHVRIRAYHLDETGYYSYNSSY